MRSAFLDALPVTLSLVGGAALIAIAAGLGLALLCVRYQGRWQDRLITTAAERRLTHFLLVLAGAAVGLSLPTGNGLLPQRGIRAADRGPARLGAASRAFPG